LAINELNVENKICKMEKGEIRRERTSKYNTRPHFLEWIKRGGQVRSQDRERKPVGNGNLPTIEYSG
jgi:hypothetical protein